MNWYSLRVMSGREEKVRDTIFRELDYEKELRSNVEEILIPTENVVDIKNGKKQLKKKVFFPGYRFSEIVSLAEIQTLDHPSSVKKKGVLHDMEASGFIDFATRFSCNELVFSFKVVSDNTEQDMKLIDKTMVDSLIGNRLKELGILLDKIIILSKLEKQRLKIPDGVEEVFEQFHFSVTRRIQLIEKFRKWKVNFPNQPTSDLVKGARTAADVIRNIDDALTDLKFDWT